MQPQKKLLQQERIIQLSGALMMLSPIGNLILLVTQLNMPNKWTSPVLMQIFSKVSTIHWILYSLSMIVGAMMMKGRRSSWIFVLVLLSFFILESLRNFTSDLQRGWFVPVMNLGVNIAVFVLVYTQEFRQSKGTVPNSSATISSVAEPAPQNEEAIIAPVAAEPIQSSNVIVPAENTFASKPQSEIHTEDAEFEVDGLVDAVISFERLGPWAQVNQVTDTEIIMRSFREPPVDIAHRTVEIQLTKKQILLFQLSERRSQDFVFKLVGSRAL